MSNAVCLSIISFLISVVLMLALEIHGKERILRNQGRYWRVSSNPLLRNDPNNYDDNQDIHWEAYDDYDRLQRDNRRDLASIDALDMNKCGKANYADKFMKKLDSFACQSGKLARDETYSRIAGGYLPKLGDFPSMVQVKFRNDSIRKTCGGTIIHNDLVLTARHCMPNNHTDAWIIAGTLSADNEDKTGTVVKVVNNCQSYRFDLEKILDDWLVLKLEKPLTYSTAIQPTCLEFWRQRALNVACITVGFGSVNETHAAERQRGSIMSPCRRERQPESITVDKTLDGPYGSTCYQRFAGKPWSGNTCTGDSGSPMYCFDNSNSRAGPRMYTVALLTLGVRADCSLHEDDYSYWLDLYKNAFTGMYRILDSCVRLL